MVNKICGPFDYYIYRYVAFYDCVGFVIKYHFAHWCIEARNKKIEMNQQVLNLGLPKIFFIKKIQKERIEDSFI